MTQEQIAALVKRLRDMGFHGTENVLHRTRRWAVERKEAADMLEQLAADNARLRLALQDFKEFDDLPLHLKRPDVFELKVRRPILAALQEKPHD